jgi:hypothetical protein
MYIEEVITYGYYYEKLCKLMIRDEEVVKETGKPKD